MNDAQIKNAQLQNAIQQQLEYLIILNELYEIIAGIIPGFVWTGWGTQKTVSQTTEQDLEGLNPGQASAWGNAVTVAYTDTLDS